MNSQQNIYISPCTEKREMRQLEKVGRDMHGFIIIIADIKIIINFIN